MQLWTVVRPASCSCTQLGPVVHPVGWLVAAAAAAVVAVYLASCVWAPVASCGTAPLSTLSPLLANVSWLMECEKPSVETQAGPQLCVVILVTGCCYTCSSRVIMTANVDSKVHSHQRSRLWGQPAHSSFCDHLNLWMCWNYTNILSQPVFSSPLLRSLWLATFTPQTNLIKSPNWSLAALRTHRLLNSGDENTGWLKMLV